jgi:tRNA(Ile)-lysidine synthase
MNLLKEFQQFIKKQNLFQPKDKLLLAVSGGVDSVVLCELCKQAGYDFIIAHCNFQLRGEESERDEKFVRSLGDKYAVEVLVKRFNTEDYARDMKLGIQEAARKLRYDWFMEIFLQKNVPDFHIPSELPGWHSTIYPNSPKWYVATAHHINDSIETMLMNFFKGTGIKGLKGISPKRKFLELDYLIRPMLFAHKEEIILYAREYKLEFVEDSSNASDKYTRNYFRNELIPGLQKVFPQVEENLLNNIERFREIEMLYQQSISLHKKKLMEPKGNEMHIPVLKLLKTEPLHTIVYEIIKDYGFTAHQTGEAIDLLKSESGKYIQSLSHRVIKNRNWLIISPNESTEASNILIEKGDKEIEFEHGKIAIEFLSAANYKLKTANSIAQIDAAAIRFPLLLRRWKKGDYFYPLGMQNPPAVRAGKKKLSRFFIDQKLSVTQKEKTWVIEMDKKIIWVAGLRLDDRFKITDKTTDILRIILSGTE